MRNLLDTRAGTFTSALADHARFRRQLPAVVFHHGSAATATTTTTTYGELGRRMHAEAGGWGRRLPRGSRVATLLGNDSADVLATMFGVVHAGMCLVPLNASLKPNQIQGMLADSHARAVVASRALAHLVGGAAVDRYGFDFASRFAGDLEGGEWHAFKDFGEGAAGAPTVPIELDWEFNITYTSGTTGTPKGIVQTHANRLHWCWSNAIALQFQPDSRALTTTALYSNGTFLMVLPALFVGASLHVLPQFDPVRTLETIQRERITHTFMVPTQLKMCLEAGAAKYDLSSLRALLSAGSALPRDVKRRVLLEMSPNLYELYGCSEGFASMLYPHEQHVKGDSVGRPLFGNSVKIVATPPADDEGDGDDHPELATGEVGEIVVRGPGMMMMYNNREQETLRELWRGGDSPAVAGYKETYFRTGDVGRIDHEGFLYIVDRKKDMIVSGGFNVFPKDIEEVMQTHTLVKDVAVLGVPHSKWGETPCAIVIPKSEEDAGSRFPEELREWTNARVSKVQRVSYVKVLSASDAFPRNVLGKVMKKDLRSRLTEWNIPRF